MATQPFKRLIRFIPQSSPHRILLGQPVDPTLDIGLAAYHNKPISVDIFSGSTILSPGHSTGTTDIVKTLLSPLTSPKSAASAASVSTTANTPPRSTWPYPPSRCCS